MHGIEPVGEAALVLVGVAQELEALRALGAARREAVPLRDLPGREGCEFRIERRAVPVDRLADPEPRGERDCAAAEPHEADSVAALGRELRDRRPDEARALRDAEGGAV